MKRSRAAICGQTHKRYRINKSGIAQKFTGNRWRRVCEHDLRSDQCRQCKTKDGVHVRSQNQACAHSSNRHMCRLCNPKYYCKHGVFHQHCALCGGSQVCKACGTKKQQAGGFCTTCHPDYVPTLAGMSKIACECFGTLEQELDVHLQRTRIKDGTIDRNEFRPPEMRRAPVDAYHADSRTVFEFLGDYWHGHPRLQTNSDASNHFGTLHCESFARTELKLRTLWRAQYNVYYIWESDYVRYKKETGCGDLWSTWRRFTGRLES
jgi:hypothetical protein